jgi:hypothetical protein
MKTFDLLWSKVEAGEALPKSLPMSAETQKKLSKKPSLDELTNLHHLLQREFLGFQVIHYHDLLKKVA